MSAPGGERQGPGQEPGAQTTATDAAIAQILSDPEFMSRRLSDDLAEVAALGREGATADPELAAEQLVAAVRAQADRLGFRSPVAAATAALRHVGELPLAERGAEGPIGPYHRGASQTVADGGVVREWITEDAGIELVFHRRAAEPNDTGVLLEAAVRVEPTGEVFLTSYGWATRAVRQPTFSFDGTASGYVEQMLADLRAAGESPAAFERAMLMAYGGGVATYRDGPLPSEVTEPAQREVLRLAVEHVQLLGRYIEDAVDLAERGGLSDWAVACVRRSAAESLFAGFLGSATFELIDSDALTEWDEAIAEAARGLPAAPRRALVPGGTPGSHEWWLAEGR
ncbi:MAG: hypothetical protein GEU94_08780 [Micromonosporaceae bacterium]|nr:hypothetical protein [Micromonosporaceae bacterium]